VSRIAAGLRSPYVPPIAAAVALQLAVLAGIRLFAANAAGGDLCQDAVAVHRLLSGQPLYAPVTSCGVLHNLPHPPAATLLLIPFLVLPIGWGALLWDLTMLAALGAALTLIARELRLRPGPWRLGLALAFVAVWPPLLGTLLEGQIAPLLLLLFVLTWRAARRGRGGWAGLALGLAAVLRLYPALLLVYFALRRDWRATLVGGVTVAVGSLALLPVIGVGGYLDYALRQVPANTADWIISVNNVSLSGLAYHLFVGHAQLTPLLAAPTLATLVSRALLAALLVLLVVVTFLRRRAPQRRDEGTFLAYLPAMLLISPLTWSHYLVVTLLPCAVLAARLGWLGPARETLPSGKAGGKRRMIAWLFGAALALVEVYFALGFLPLPRPLAPVTTLLYLNLPTYALLLLFAALLLLETPQRRLQRMPLPAWALRWRDRRQLTRKAA
jgi:alpha-1,2-mannosyltransferase